MEADKERDAERVKKKLQHHEESFAKRVKEVEERFAGLIEDKDGELTFMQHALKEQELGFEEEFSARAKQEEHRVKVLSDRIDNKEKQLAFYEKELMRIRRTFGDKAGEVGGLRAENKELKDR